MELQQKKQDSTLATLVHISTLSKYIIPLGNFIFPLIIWTSIRKDKLTDAHGKEALNFQISIFLYFVFIICATVAGILLAGLNSGFENDFYFFHYGIQAENISDAIPFMVIGGTSGILVLALFILDLVCVINAAIQASNGEYYKYPLSIPFIKSSNYSENEQNKNIQNDTL
ncbi:MAG TPA: DUF4870 domain-containing protein [Salinimicrobium sp.]|nr:DUF4870 domain-containing protein [Salinimicrobium sp.]